MSAHTYIVYDWHLDLRAGGPTGYLANLKTALGAMGDDRIEFIHRGTRPKSGTSLAKSITGSPGLLRLFDDHDSYRRLAGTEMAAGMLAALETLDGARLSQPVADAVLASKATVFHVHTTADAVRLHNLLVRHGRRHACKIVLMSHTPECPAREWADVAHDASGDARLAETIFDAHRLRDQLAFVFADALIFPNRESMDPCIATWPGFADDFRHKPLHFAESGVMPLGQSQLADPKAHFGQQGRFVVSFLGRHNAIKGYDLLCRAGLRFLAQHDDAAVLIAGKPEPMTPPAHPRWTEIGWTKTPEDVIAASDVFVLPNRLTYFDLVLLEVLSAGRIVLAANNGGSRALSGRSSGIVLFDGEDDLVAKLAEIRAMDPERRRAMEQENRRLYETDFTATAFAARYAETATRIVEDFTVRPVGALRTDGAPGVDVSVIVPVYNVEDYLAQCLDSILAQDHPSFEVIVVDDGSTDACPDILNTYASDPRLRVIRQENGGLSAARNTGLLHAAGRFICFVDSDDHLDPRFLSTMQGQMERDGTDMAFCAITIFDTQNSAVHSALHDEDDFLRANPGTQIPATLDNITRMFPSAWNKLYRASVFDGLAYPVGYLYEDNPVHLQAMLRLDRVSYVKQPLYFHRDDRPTRISKTSSLRMLEVAHIASLLYSAIRDATNASVARDYGTRLLQRLFWERFWSVRSEQVNLFLSAALVQMADLIGTDDDHAAMHRDQRQEPEFLRNKRRFLTERKAATGSRLHLAPDDRMTLRETSLAPSGRFLRDSGSVTRKEDQSILIHPATDHLSIVEIGGIGLYGDITVDLQFGLEHPQAARTEVRALLAPERIDDPAALRNRLSSPTPSETLSDWTEVEAAGTAVLSLRARDLGPCLTIYIASRPVEEDVAFAWLHLRKIALARRKMRTPAGMD